LAFLFPPSPPKKTKCMKKQSTLLPQATTAFA
jgi:hypothetical protein